MVSIVGSKCLPCIKRFIFSGWRYILTCHNLPGNALQWLQWMRWSCKNFAPIPFPLLNLKRRDGLRGARRRKPKVCANFQYPLLPLSLLTQCRNLIETALLLYTYICERCSNICSSKNPRIIDTANSLADVCHWYLYSICIATSSSVKSLKLVQKITLNAKRSTFIVKYSSSKYATQNTNTSSQELNTANVDLHCLVATARAFYGALYGVEFPGLQLCIGVATMWMLGYVLRYASLLPSNNWFSEWPTKFSLWLHALHIWSVCKSYDSHIPSSSVKSCDELPGLVSRNRNEL